jgi:hypothetical protein
MENRYETCLRLAEAAKQAKQEAARNRTWTVDDILDTEDMLEGKRRMWSFARRVFRSLSPTSAGMDVPQTAILNILQTAMQGFDKSLTKRQQAAAEAYDEAIHLGITPSTHVAAKLGINRHSAYKLIQRANLETFHEFVHYIYRSVYQMDDWSPTPQQVKAMMKARARTCAYCGGNTRDGSLPLCFGCHSKLGSLREEAWNYRTRSWLAPEIRRIENEHREWAIDQCYLAHCGAVPIEQYEFLMDAG